MAFTKRHKKLTNGDAHTLVWKEAVDTAARLAIAVAEEDEGKLVHQTDNNSYWVLTDYAVPTYTEFTAAGAAAVTSIFARTGDVTAQPGDYTNADVGLGNVENTKVNLAAGTSPAVTNDSGEGYSVGSLWINVATDTAYIASDVTVGAAVWTEITGGAGGIGTWGFITGNILSQADLQAQFGGKADTSHVHAATDVTSGTFADAQIAESNVTQHEAAIDHDALTNMEAAEHIDWTIAGAEQIDASRYASGAGGATNTVTGGTGITNTGDNVNAVLEPTYGATADTIAEGNDTRIVNSAIHATTTTGNPHDLDAADVGAAAAVHATTHENGGGDEISVAGLSGVLADGQLASSLETTGASVDVAGAAPPTGGNFVLVTNDATTTSWLDLQVAVVETPFSQFLWVDSTVSSAIIELNPTTNFQTTTEAKIPDVDVQGFNHKNTWNNIMVGDRIVMRNGPEASNRGFGNSYVVDSVSVQADHTVLGITADAGTGGAIGGIVEVWLSVHTRVAPELGTTGASVNVDAAAPPTTGQILKATSATTATWQTSSANLNIEDEGTPVAGGPHGTMNFIGGGVTATDAGGGQVDVTIAPGAAPVDTVFGRTGTVVAVADDYTAAQVTNVPAGDIAAVTVQAAIDELDTDKAAVGHTQVYTTVDGVPTDTFLGRDSAGTGATEAMSPTTARALLNVEDGSVAAGTAGDAYATSHEADATAHAASEITNTPFGDIGSTTVQGALNELDTEKSNTAHTHTLSGITDSGTAAAENVGVAIGDVVQLENVGGNAGVPAVDGSQLTGVTSDANISVVDADTGPTTLTTNVQKFTYTGAGVTLSEPVADEVTITISGAAPGVIDVSDGTTTVSSADLLTFNATAFDVVDQGANDADVNPIFGTGAGQLAEGDHTHDTLANVTQDRLIGRLTAGSGLSEELTGTQAAGLLDHADLGAGIGTNTHAQIDTHIADTANPHATDIGNLGSGTLAELNTAVTDATLIDTADSRLSDARTPLAHNQAFTTIDSVPTDTFLGRDTAATGAAEAMTPAAAAALLDHANLGAGIGTNTHAQLDAHIADTSGNPHGISFGNLLDDTLVQLNNRITDADTDFRLRLEGIGAVAGRPSAGIPGRFWFDDATGERTYDDGATWVASAGGGTVDTSGTPVATDFARFTDADTIEGRSPTEVIADLGIDADITTLTIGASATVTGSNTGDSAAHAYSVHTGTIPSDDFADNTIAVSRLADGTDGELITWSAAGVATTVAVGTSGHVLTSGGVGVAPTFAAAPSAPTLSKTVTIEDPVTAEDISIFFTPVAITITEMRAVVRGTTPSVLWFIKHGTDRSAAGAAVVTAGTTTTSQTTGSDVTSFNDATIVADSFVWLETTTVSGTNDELSVTIVYTED